MQSAESFLAAFVFGDSYDNALAESVIGLFKTEVIRRRGPWRNVDAVEYATLEWVDWFNNRRLLEPIGFVPQPTAISDPAARRPDEHHDDGPWSAHHETLTRQHTHPTSRLASAHTRQHAVKDDIESAVGDPAPECDVVTQRTPSPHIVCGSGD